MHQQAYEFIATNAKRLGHVEFVLEIGSRNVNGSVRGLFSSGRYLGLDVMPGPGVDVVANGAEFVPDGQPDVVVCCEVLEHADAAPTIVSHALSLLRSGGVLLLTAAGPERAPHSAIDGGPLRSGEHYRNIRVEDLEAWLPEGDRSIVHDPMAGDVYARAVKS
jgi:SAM-dependent methyltransferase